MSKSHTTAAAKVTAELDQYSYWRPCFHKTSMTRALQIQHPR